MDKKLDDILECLIDEIMHSKDPSDTTLEVLGRYRNYELVRKYFEWLDKS